MKTPKPFVPVALALGGRGVVLSYFNANDEVAGSIPAGSFGNL